MVEDKSILIFGAGKIGRSFIGQLFGLSGYEVIFADIDRGLVEELNRRRSYCVTIKGEKEETLFVPNVRAVSALDREQVIKEVSKASILSISVGKGALKEVVALIGEALRFKYLSGSASPTDIIIAENMRFASEFMKKELLPFFPANFPFERLIGLVETCIGKMVPFVKDTDLISDPLAVVAEPYNELIVDRKGFRGQIPMVKGLCPKENIKAWVDRKTFIHNLGHATVVYFGSARYPDAIFIHEVMADQLVYDFAAKVMLQSANTLQKLYPDDFSLEDLKVHIDDLLKRFQNRALQDTLSRVGQDLLRKLGPEDRFVGIIRLALKHEMDYNRILEAMAYAFHFKLTVSREKVHAQDLIFYSFLSKGIEYTLQKVCEFDPVKDKKLIMEFLKIYNNTLIFK